MAGPPAKRRRLSGAKDSRNPGPASLDQPISPPPRKSSVPRRTLLPSPFRLTAVRDLPPELNVDAVRLGDLLGDPLISECWEFNYLHDIDFLVKQFDEDTRSLVKIHVVHGFWKKEDPSRLHLHEQASRYHNVELHTAYMPEMFGTHHSKMLVVFRHDDTAQVIIHTANMIAKDWANMTNGVWQSPLLPRSKPAATPSPSDTTAGNVPAVGSGLRFKTDLLRYLRAYNSKRDVCSSLAEALGKYDFSAVRGAVIASVPGRHAANDSQVAWGWAAMKHTLQCVPVSSGKADIAVQISSIATLGGTDSWLQRTLFDSLSVSRPRPSFHVVFPTSDEIRRSLDGYASGGSIHTKTQSIQQAKQLLYLRPLFCHWANDAPDGASIAGENREAGRKRAAPHIKTYIRHSEDGFVDWALLTSANVSKQAWGDAANPAGEVRIASWEIGILVWPELIAPNAKMVGVFKSDMLSHDENRDGDCPLVGLRMPYNLPLQKYGGDEVPWVATANHAEPDWMGRAWVT